MQTQLRAVFNTALTTAGGGLTTLSDIGVAFASDGRLALDAAKLQRVLDDPTKDVATLFAAVGRPTDSLIAFTRAGTATKSGDYAVSVSQIATRGATAGSVQLGATTLITAGVNDALDIVLDGVAASVTIGAGSYSRAQLAAALQSAINGAAPLVAASAAASVSLTGANELVITSNRYGAASGASVTGGYAQASIFGAAAFAAPGTDVAGSIGGAAAAGSGQALIGSGDAAELELRVNGGATGARGSVKYAQGFAYQLDRLVSGLLAADGPLAARTDGVSSSIRALQSRKDALERRLDLVETRYRAQFAALDAALASMTKTSAFLQQQLASLVQNPGSSDR
ncbi:MAG: flagellar filament capping protein FliD [Burkholderiales bacterium]|nr:flagellar filament capping protein FliD [Burkholderiales bacterium]